MGSDLGLHCLPIIILGISRLQWVNTETEKIDIQATLGKSLELAVKKSLFPNAFKFTMLLINSEHSSRRTTRVANEVSSMVENMIKEK